jgi:hypothetical protein
MGIVTRPVWFLQEARRNDCTWTLTLPNQVILLMGEPTINEWENAYAHSLEMIHKECQL